MPLPMRMRMRIECGVRLLCKLYYSLFTIPIYKHHYSVFYTYSMQNDSTSIQWQYKVTGSLSFFRSLSLTLPRAHAQYCLLPHSLTHSFSCSFIRSLALVLTTVVASSNRKRAPNLHFNVFTFYYYYYNLMPFNLGCNANADAFLDGLKLFFSFFFYYYYFVGVAFIHLFLQIEPSPAMLRTNKNLQPKEIPKL